MEKPTKTTYRELLFTALGVVLAFAIASISEKLTTQKKVETAYNSIKNELTKNLAEINTVLVHQELLSDSIQAFHRKNEVSIFQVIRSVKGLKTPDIFNTAWPAAVATNIIYEFDYGFVEHMSEIQERNESLKRQMSYLITAVLNEKGFEVSRSKSLLTLFGVSLKDLMNLEKKQKNSIRKAIVYLDRLQNP